jgi:hypothetical protein
VVSFSRLLKLIDRCNGLSEEGRALLRNSLDTRAGFVVIPARHGSTFLESLTAHGMDVILLSNTDFEAMFPCSGSVQFPEETREFVKSVVFVYPEVSDEAAALGDRMR